jgi:hypothetical protein
MTMSNTKTARSVVGAALSIGAGLGATAGVLVEGAGGIAIGAGVGAAVGVIAGAARHAFHSTD